MTLEGLGIKLDSWVWEDFLADSLGVEVCDGGEAMGAALSGSALFDPVELGEFTLGVGCSFESGSKRRRTLDTHVELMIAPGILFLLAT